MTDSIEDNLVRASHSFGQWRYTGMGNSERTCSVCGFRQDGLMPDGEVPPCGAGRGLSSARLVQVRCPDYMSLFCDNCGTTFLTYDPNAERGHPVQLGAILDDAARHAKECPDG